jgi:endonuclease/exonuclease/phosphatase family metal-dependent hydrolase
MRFFFVAIPLLLIFHVSFAHASHDLRIASYNIKGLPFPIQINHTSRYKKIVQEIKAMNSAGNAPDILLIQEAFSFTTGYLYKNLSNIYPYRIKGPARTVRWNSGLEILSRYPFTQAFSVCAGSDCLARKGVLFGRVKLPGALGEVDLYNTHMQANLRDGDYDLPGSSSQLIRNQQTESMISFVNRTHDNKRPFFLGGDFNSRPYNANYQRFLTEYGDIDTSKYCQRSRSCRGYGNRSDRYWNVKIDHIFFGSGSVTVVPVDYEQFFNGMNYSDHDMIMGTYRIGRFMQLGSDILLNY